MPAKPDCQPARIFHIHRAKDQRGRFCGDHLEFDVAVNPLARQRE
jgi:hypothetical protein